MSEIKKITAKILLLVLDIFLFGLNTARQIVLPNKKRKGTILTSLFVFFTGALDRLESFEHGAFKMTKLLRHKYLKPVLFVVTGLLFLLSALEQEPVKNFSFNTGTSIERSSEAALVKMNSSKRQPLMACCETLYLNKSCTPCKKIVCKVQTLYLPAKKTYLRFRTMRI